MGRASQSSGRRGGALFLAFITMGLSSLASAQTASVVETQTERRAKPVGGASKPDLPSRVASSRIDAAVLPVPPRTYQERILRRVTVPLQVLSAVDSMATPGQELSDFMLFDKMNQDVVRGLDKATRRVIGEYLLEAADLRPALDAMNIGSKPGRGFGYDVSFYHTLPKLELKHSAGRGEVELGLAMQGTVSLTYKLHREHPARIHASFDGEDRYQISCRIGF